MLTTPPDSLPLSEASSKVTAAGRVSVTTTSVAAAGPKFVTVMV